eukprot:4215308-Prymnesium_polylepis.1
MPPGMAHSPVSRRWIATICSWPDAGWSRVTIESAAWLAPHLPSSPRPQRPVRPRGLSGAPSTRRASSLKVHEPAKVSSERSSSSARRRLGESGSAHPPSTCAEGHGVRRARGARAQE